MAKMSEILLLDLNNEMSWWYGFVGWISTKSTKDCQSIDLCQSRVASHPIKFDLHLSAKRRGASLVVVLSFSRIADSFTLSKSYLKVRFSFLCFGFSFVHR